MEYLFAAGVLGFCVGIFSIYYQRTFMIMLLGLPPIALGCINFFAPTLMVVSLNEGNGISGVLGIFNTLPELVKSCIIIFPISVFVGRFLAWLRVKFGKPKEESMQARKKRIYKAYGYKNGMPY